MLLLENCNLNQLKNSVSYMSFIKMSTKLTIHRIEEENNFHTLHMTIDESNKDSPEIKFGAWHDGKTEMKKKEKNKPRVIVKMVTDENFSNLNLDSCYEIIDHTDEYINSILNKTDPLHDDMKGSFYSRSSKIDETDSKNMHKKYCEQPNVNEISQTQCKIPQFFKSQFDTKNNDGIDPLESSLEKVKKNNALIMENIHMLNRTLNYTKKKEILDIINPKPFKSYSCTVCGKCFVYETGLRRHYSTRHDRLDSQLRWQFVWTCTECFQVWPRQDLAIKHAIQCNNPNNVDFVQEIKTSSLLQCEFCEKVFTCIPRLLTHSKMHSVTRNYQCNACDVAFSCYKSAEQHWLTCLWLKMSYQFSLPKLLLCNVCDRKFRNYDQLYNHRYKVDHFISKISDDNNFAYMPMLVYQCEVCGQWFHVISQLQDHQSQYHPQNDNIIL